MINLGKTVTLTAGALKGAGVLSEAWLNRRRLFAKYDTIYDTIAEIHQNLNSALETTPVHLALFDGDTSNKDVQASTGLIHIVSSFAGISGIDYAAGFEGGGRKALHCNTTNITLASKARTEITTAFTFSVCVKPTAANSGYTGVLGGVIFGNGHWGVGYALGWAPSIQGNKPSIEVYTGTGNDDGAATLVHGSTALEVNKWYNIVGRCTISGGTCKIDMWVNKVWTGGSTTRNNNSIGYQSLSGQTQSSNLHLGRVHQSGWNYFKGCIQDFVLWRTAIPDAQIDKIHDYYQRHGMFGGVSPTTWTTPEIIGVILEPSYCSNIDYMTYNVNLLGLLKNGSNIVVVDNQPFVSLMGNVVIHNFEQGDKVTLIMLVIQSTTGFTTEMVGLLATDIYWQSNPNAILVKLRVLNGNTLVGRTGINPEYTWNGNQGGACPLHLFIAPVDTTLGREIAAKSLAPGLIELI